MQTEFDIRTEKLMIREIALAEGMEKEREEGMEKSKLSIAREMLKKGLSLELVSEWTGLTAEALGTL